MVEIEGGIGKLARAIEYQTECIYLLNISPLMPLEALVAKGPRARAGWCQGGRCTHSEVDHHLPSC